MAGVESSKELCDGYNKLVRRSCLGQTKTSYKEYLCFTSKKNKLKTRRVTEKLSKNEFKMVVFKS
jgi:hypothetical protein